MGVLLMLLTICGSILATILLVISLARKKVWLAKFTLGGVVIWLVFYFAMLFGFSYVSTEKSLAMNVPKEYCGFYLDYHVHAAVISVRMAKQIGSETAQGIFYIVRVKVFSDAKNPAIALRLTEPRAEVVDEGERIYTRIAAAESQLPTANVQLNQDVKGDQGIEKEIVFDITEPATELKLLITEGYGIDKYIEAFLIDDEDSIFHKKNYFKLYEQRVTASVK